MTELYHSDSATVSGRRCETREDLVQRDQYGRPIDPACRDLNPGTMHVAMTGLLGLGAKLHQLAVERAGAAGVRRRLHLAPRGVELPGHVVRHRHDDGGERAGGSAARL